MQPYGGFWIRFLAYIIDAIILQIAISVLLMVIGGLVFAIGTSESAAMALVVVGYGFSFVLNWLYFTVLESSTWQATVGKKALNLIVTDEQGERIGFGRANGRYFGKILSSLILAFGFFMVGWTQRKQGLHDMIAGTVVYKTNSPHLARNSAEVFS